MGTFEEVSRDVWEIEQVQASRISYEIIKGYIEKKGEILRGNLWIT